uniref:VP6 n=1 Tax=Rotavirus K TaxID=2682575 RepID=A0A650D789_9REOV|nr:VP6 [Rotavirus K]
MVRTLNGNLFVTGGIGNQPLRQFDWKIAQLGNTLLNVDANYMEQARATAQELADFVIAVCDDELVRESNRNGMAPQSPALITLNTPKFKHINYDNCSELMRGLNVQNRRGQAYYSYTDPSIFPYRNSYVFNRADPQFTNVMGTRYFIANNEIQLAAFDSEWCATAANNTRRFVFTQQLKRRVLGATLLIENAAGKLNNTQAIPTTDNRTTWCYRPVQVFRGQQIIEFYDNGILVDVQRDNGTVTTRSFDTVRIIIDIVRPRMTQRVDNLFPQGGPWLYHAAYMLTLKFTNVVMDTVICDVNDPDFSIIGATRRDTAMPIGPVFPAGFQWNDILQNFTVPQEDNLNRLMIIASIKRLAL